MRFCALVLLGLVQLCGIAVAAEPDLAPPQVKALVREMGAQTAVRDLLKDEKVWDRILERIEAGEAAWIEVAPELLRGSDAGATAALRIALSNALKAAPTAVLAAAQGALKLDQICRPQMIEPTRAELRAFVRKTAAALAKVRDPKLDGAARDCRKFVLATRK